MSFNSFGNVLKITTFGESHGECIGVIIDGCPSGLKITQDYIQKIVDTRKSTSIYTTKRKEPDLIEILSGIYEDKTLGTPIAIIVKNKNIRSNDYDNIKNIFRPSHADFTWHNKFLHTDYRGGGRSSARETVARVIGGAIAQKLLEKQQITIIAYMHAIGDFKIDYNKFDNEFITQNPFSSPDQSIIPKWKNILDNIMNEGDSIGGIIGIIIKNTPVGLGEPIFEKLNSNLAKSLFSIPGVKGVEFGDGFNLSSQYGSHVADAPIIKDDKVSFTNNHNGGILGGISNGEDITIKIAIKPTSSIRKPQNTITHDLSPETIQIHGRHDPCIAIRAVSICKAMVALVIADHWLISKIRNI